jgi:hypothetical protein
MPVLYDPRVSNVQDAVNLFGFQIKSDDYLGDETRKALSFVSLGSNSPYTKMMKVPMFGGLCSSFGGKYDSGDRLEWQAYLPYVDRTKVSPKQYAEKYQGVIRKDERGVELLNWAEMLTYNSWPKTTGVNGVPGIAGLSFFLNTGSLYCALPMLSELVLAITNSGQNLLQVLVYNHKTGKSCVCCLSDYGPHPSTKRNIDLSPEAMSILGSVTDTKLMFYILS